MSSMVKTKTMVPEGIGGQVLMRLLEEGYGPGAWHGADLRAALAEVPAALAFWRPNAGRHNIAEIALHHAWSARNVRAQLAGSPAEPFVLDGEDWFTLPDEKRLSWKTVQATVETEQQRLTDLLADIAAGRAKPAVGEAERFDVILGLTCHAVYHAGQIQLIKVLHAG